MTRDHEQETPDWHAEPRPCPFCEVMHCGCPNEPEPLIPNNVELGWE
jgi:hypothetical protein